MTRWLKSLFLPEYHISEYYRKELEKALERRLEELELINYAKWLAGAEENRYLTMEEPLTYTVVDNGFSGIEVKNQEYYYELLDTFKSFGQLPEEVFYFVGDL